MRRQHVDNWEVPPVAPEKPPELVVLDINDARAVVRVQCACVLLWLHQTISRCFFKLLAFQTAGWSSSHSLIYLCQQGGLLLQHI